MLITYYLSKSTHKDSHSGCADLLKGFSRALDSKRSLFILVQIGGCRLSPSSPSFELLHLQTPDWLNCLNVSQGEQLQCTAHTWLSPRHVLVAAEKGKVIHDEDHQHAEGWQCVVKMKMISQWINCPAHCEKECGEGRWQWFWSITFIILNHNGDL